MRLAAALLLCALTCIRASAQTALAAARPQLGAALQTITLNASESRTLQVYGATAAWSLDPTIVEAGADNGSLRLTARGAGRTKVIVTGMTGEITFEVSVAGRPSSKTARRTGRDHATAEVRYAGAAREVQTAVSVTQEDAKKKTDIRVLTTHQTGDQPGDRASTSITTASVNIAGAGRELTILDKDVDQSPLTIDSTPVRGLHYADEQWQLHAGYTAYATYQSFIVPIDRQLLASASRTFRMSDRSRLTPSILTIAGEGSVLSLLYGYEQPERLVVSGEVAWGGTPGGAASLDFQGNRDRVHADVRYRPQSFASLASSPRGLLADATWSRSYGSGSTLAAAASASELAQIRSRGASLDVDHRLNERVSLIGGASFGSFSGTRSLSIPAGARLDFARGGVGAVYRYSRSSRNEGGHGYRVFGRASAGRFHINAWLDAQENAPTLDVIFSERPDLALALEELGITASSPSDIARALRENASLIDLGFIEGVTVNLAPQRTQYGLDFSWHSGDATRQRVRLRFLRNETGSVATERSTTLASLMWSRRMFTDTEIFAGYSWWRTTSTGQLPNDQRFLDLGIRHRFNGLPSLGGSGTITGAVFADEDLDGRPDGTPLAAEVELDGEKKQATAPDGSFTFRNVPRGAHQVVARIPARAEAYFTTPSRVEASPGDRVTFGVATTPARLMGRVTSDAGEGLAGIRVEISRGDRRMTAITGSNGSFSIATAPGEWQATLLTDSLPAGYSLPENVSRPLQLVREEPATVAWQIRAHRSVKGSGAQPNAAIRIPALNRTVNADASGQFTIRSLPAGDIVVVAGGVERRVQVPASPAALTLDFAPVTIAANAPAIRIEAHGERRDTLRWIVALGAFRVHANAVQAASVARRSGVTATMRDRGTLTVVSAGPFVTREAAQETATKLEDAGLETVVMAAQ